MARITMGDIYLFTNGIARLGAPYGIIEESPTGSKVPGLYGRTVEACLLRSLTPGTFGEVLMLPTGQLAQRLPGKGPIEANHLLVS